MTQDKKFLALKKLAYLRYFFGANGRDGGSFVGSGLAFEQNPGRFFDPVEKTHCGSKSLLSFFGIACQRGQV